MVSLMAVLIVATTSTRPHMHFNCEHCESRMAGFVRMFPYSARFACIIVTQVVCPAESRHD